MRLDPERSNGTNRELHRPRHAKRNWRVAAAAGSVLTVLAIALVLGLYRPARSAQPGPAPGSPSEDALAVLSRGRDVNGSTPGPAMDQKAQEEKQSIAEQQALAAQQAAQQQAAQQQAALAEQERQLQMQAAEQATKEKQLEEDRQRIAMEKQQADAAAAEAEKQRSAAAAERMRTQPVNRSQPAYNGPSSGTIVWQGQVNGTTLVTIAGNASDTGQVISGALPGVLVMVQPADTKHVVVAGAPAPSNGYRRMMLRIEGKGTMQEVIHWSIP